MKKIMAITVIFLAIFTTAYFLFNSKEKNKSSSSQEVSKNKTQLQVQKEKLKEYLDPSGFKFSYPEYFTLGKNEAKNDSVYSSLVLTPEDGPGKITIVAETSKAKKVDEIAKSATQTAAVDKLKLADLDALQTTTDKKITTIALDRGVLFTITAEYPNDKQKWQDANQKIVSSFKFTPPESTEDQSSSDSSLDDVTFEGEEVVE